MQSKTADEILAHPRFAEARNAHIDALVGLFAGDLFVTRIGAEMTKRSFGNRLPIPNTGWISTDARNRMSPGITSRRDQAHR